MERFCRGCLNKFNEPTDLLQYCESNRRLFVYSTGLQVKRNDTFTFQLCKECFLNMKLTCKFKKQCRNSDKMFKNYLALKEDGDTLDFSTYIKNGGDTNLRFPVLSRSSTPTHQRIDDDDNESTCTSMQNFMTDMLEGEEMPPTEDRIIREVIQEEADILDDSLDSHWLEEDAMSMETDFRMDFNFAISTPRSINNDHCYTPRRLTDDKEEELNYYTSKNIIERCNETKIVQQNDMPILDDCALKFDDVAVRSIVMGDLETEYCIKESNTAQNNDMPILDDCDIEFDGVFDSNVTLGELETGYCIESIKEPDMETISKKEKMHNCDNFVQSKVTDISEDDPLTEHESFKTSLLSESNDISPFVNSEKVSMTNKNSQDFIAPLANENEISVVLNTGIADKKVSDSPLSCELKHYMNKVEFNKNKAVKKNEQNKALSNGKDICVLLNQYEVGKTINQSPFTRELEQYINKSTLKKAIDLESNLGDEGLNIFKSTNNAKQSGEDISVILNQTENILNVEDSPIKHELELYINKAELKKKSKRSFNHDTASANNVNIELCSIDRNLELALKNDANQEFSLDQLLDSPQVSLRSAASTPTINNILFGSITPRGSNVSKFVDTVNIEETDPTHFIEEFLKFDNSKHQSIPGQQFKDIGESKNVKNKDINVTFKFEDAVKIQEVNSDFVEVFLKDNDCNPQRVKERFKDQIPKAEHKQVEEKVTISVTNLENTTKIQEIDRTGFIDEFLKNENRKRKSKPMKGFNDQTERKRGKELKKINKVKLEKSKSKITRAVKDIRKLKELVKLDHEDIDELSENDQPNSLKDEEINAKEKEAGEETVSEEKVVDLDISVTSLLNFDDNPSVDLNFSISSDFIKDTESQNDPYSDIDRKEQTEYIFKRPFSPPDSKYDLDQCLCKICDKKFNSTKSLKIHLSKTHNLKTIKEKRTNKTYVPKVCQFCGKTFRDKSNLNKHLKSHDDPDVFKCEYCTLEFAKRGRLSQHMRIHANKFKKNDNKKEEDKKKIVCSTCGKMFANIANYKIHQRRHTKSYTVTCSICEQGFYRNEDLRLHMCNHSASADLTFACQLCPKVYRRRYLLIGHMYRHMNIKDFECEACNVKFVAKHLLQRHYTSMSCIKKREELAEIANEETDGIQVSDTAVAESTENVIETDGRLEESNTANSKINENLETQPAETEEISKGEEIAKIANEKSGVIETKLEESDAENSEIKEKLETRSKEIEVSESMKGNKEVKVPNIETVEISTEIFLKLEEIHSESEPPSPEAMEES